MVKRVFAIALKLVGYCKAFFFTFIFWLFSHISGVMISVLASRVPQIVGSSPCRIKPKIIKLVCDSSLLNKHHQGVREKSG